MNEALRRYNIIKPFLYDGLRLSAIALDSQIGLRTLQRWVKAFNARGMNGLARKKRSDTGQIRKVSPDIKCLIEGLAFGKKKISMATITRILNKYCAQNRLPLVQYHNVRSIVASIEQDVMTLARYGDKKYADKHEVVMRRESTHSNEIWQSDHALLDVKVALPSGKESKPWLTIVCWFTGNHTFQNFYKLLF